MRIPILLVPLAAVAASACVTQSDGPAPYKLADNLTARSEIVSPEGSRILRTLQEFHAAYEAGDEPRLLKVIGPEFTKLSVLDNKILRSVDRANFIKTIGRPINFTLSHIKRNEKGDVMLAVAMAGREGKHFSNRSVDVFLFGKNDPEKITGVVSTPLYYEKYPRDSVSIYLAPDLLSIDQIKSALDARNVDQEMDKLVSGDLAKLPRRRDLSCMVVFRSPPKPGSVVRTEIVMSSSYAQKFKFETKIGRYSPHVAMSHFVTTFGNAGSMTVEVYVDDDFVGGRTIHN